MTHFHELFPSGIFDEPNLVAANAYCIARMNAHPGKVRLRGEIIGYGAFESVISRNPFEGPYGMTEEQFERCLLELQELEICLVKKTEKYFVVCYPKHIVDAPSTQRQITVTDEGITPITFNEFVPMYVDHQENRRCQPKTIQNTLRVTKLFGEKFGDIQIHELRSKHLDEFISSRLGSGISEPTVNMDIRTLKPLMKLAVLRQYAKDNHFKDVKGPKAVKKLIPFFTRDQFAKFICLVEDELLAQVFRFGVLTGMRRGEIIFLLQKNIDYGEGIINIRASEYYRPKFGKERIFPLTPAIRRLLHEVKSDGEFVFTDSNGDIFKEDFVTKQFKKYARSADGLSTELHFHSLRATFASWAAASGVNAFILKELLGHTYIRTTEHYARIPLDDLKNSVEDFELPAVRRDALAIRRQNEYIFGADEAPNSSPNTFRGDRTTKGQKSSEISHICTGS